MCDEPVRNPSARIHNYRTNHSHDYDLILSPMDLTRTILSPLSQNYITVACRLLYVASFLRGGFCVQPTNQRDTDL